MRLHLSSLFVIFCSASLAHADVITVLPDGTGDQPTIQAAIAAAAGGDIIELGDGTFTGEGNRELDTLGKAITIRSVSGDPASCVLDCDASEENPRRIFFIHSGESDDTVLSGVTLTAGYDDTLGGAIRLEGASPRVENCVFFHNYGTAVFATGSQAVFQDCVFDFNIADRGGAVHAYVECALEFVGCEFRENLASRGGAVFGQAAGMYFEDCLFEENDAAVGGAVDLIYGAAGTFERCHFLRNSAIMAGVIEVHGGAQGVFGDCTFERNEVQFTSIVEQTKMSTCHYDGCTFWGNSSESGATIHCGEQGTTFAACIISFSTQGPAISCENEDVTLTCCDIFGNAGGNWTDCVIDQLGENGNIEEDPLFCDADSGDFTLHDASPCLPENNDCGLMGAWPIGECGLITVEETSWSRVKSLY